MSASKKEASPKKSADEEAEEIYRDIKPRLVEMIERNDPPSRAVALDRVGA